MTGFFSENTVLWTLSVAVGYPLIAILAVELTRQTKSSIPAFSRFMGLLQVSVLPVTAIYILMANVAQLPHESVALRVVLTALAISAINALLDALNSVMRSDLLTGGAANRVPGLLLDILRIFLVLIASAFVASEIWDVDLGSLLAALGVGSVVLGLALQDTLSGLFAGVSLLSGRQFKEGDWIEFGEASGKIVKMDWRSVTIETLDDERLMVIPNSELSSGIFTILSSTNRVFGQNLHVTFAYSSPPARVMEALEQAVLSVDLILRDPAHDIDLMETTDTGIAYEVTIHTASREEGEEATTQFFRRLWYICAREGLEFSGAINRMYRGTTMPSLPPQQIANALAATGIFLPSAKGISEVIAAAKAVLFDDEEKLLSAGQPFDAIHLVVSGRLSISRWDARRSRALQHLGSGEFFVSRAFLTGAPSTVELAAQGETMTIVLDSGTVKAFLNQNPGLARLFERAIDTSENGLALAGDDRRLVSVA